MCDHFEAALGEPESFDPPPARIGDWGCTFTGTHFYPIDPRPEDVSIEDIAHALSNLCRFGGHCREFYSVAQHSVLVSYEAECQLRLTPAHARAGLTAPQVGLWGLLHDAAEAYVVDVPRPLKRSPGMEAYRAIEEAHMAAVCAHFGLRGGVPQEVKRADAILLSTEAYALMPWGSVRYWYLPEPPSEGITIEPWTPGEAKRRFLSRYAEVAHA